MGDLNNAHLQVARNAELVKHIEKLEGQVKQFEIIVATSSREIQFINSYKDRIK